MKLVLENVKPCFARYLQSVAEFLGQDLLGKSFATGHFAIAFDPRSGGGRLCDLRLEVARKAARRLVVTPQETILRALVESASGGDPHLTDLEEYGGRGQCSCEDFQKRKQVFLERLQAPGDRWRVEPPLFAYECAHISAHKEWLYRETLRAVVAQRESGVEKLQIEN